MKSTILCFFGAHKVERIKINLIHIGLPFRGGIIYVQIFHRDVHNNSFKYVIATLPPPGQTTGARLPPPRIKTVSPQLFRVLDFDAVPIIQRRLLLYLYGKDDGDITV